MSCILIWWYCVTNYHKTWWFKTATFCYFPKSVVAGEILLVWARSGWLQQSSSKWLILISPSSGLGAGWSGWPSKEDSALLHVWALILQQACPDFFSWWCIAPIESTVVKTSWRYLLPISGSETELCSTLRDYMNCNCNKVDPWELSSTFHRYLNSHGRVLEPQLWLWVNFNSSAG